ncbi:MAG: fumarate hydratase [Clostridia bacterium]|nr:fumarate hydratase [Clostridia bacterium]
MKQIKAEDIVKTVSELCIKSCTTLGDDWWQTLDEAINKEESPLGKDILKQLQENAKLAAATKEALCQDTGVAVVFLELGQDVHITGGNLYEAINAGVRKGYTEGYLRKSVVNDPLIRKNTGDNTPAIIYTDIVPGDKLKITVAPKGAGSENMSALKMLKPADGREGVVQFVLDVVKTAGPNPCPPILVGVGIGGMFEKAALLAKKSLLRPLGQRNELPHIAELELELLEKINNSGIGPQGLGGRITALDVHVESHPTHIATLPVAVNIQCHATRHAEAIL